MRSSMLWRGRNITRGWLGCIASLNKCTPFPQPSAGQRSVTYNNPLTREILAVNKMATIKTRPPLQNNSHPKISWRKLCYNSGIGACLLVQWHGDTSRSSWWIFNYTAHFIFSKYLSYNYIELSKRFCADICSIYSTSEISHIKNIWLTDHGRTKLRCLSARSLFRSTLLTGCIYVVTWRLRSKEISCELSGFRALVRGIYFSCRIICVSRNTTNGNKLNFYILRWPLQQCDPYVWMILKWPLCKWGETLSLF